jgi:hypothetical protein
MGTTIPRERRTPSRAIRRVLDSGLSLRGNSSFSKETVAVATLNCVLAFT